MTLGQALGFIQDRKENLRRRKVFLICGFQPLHLETFLKGQFALCFPGEALDTQNGLFGDLEQTLVTAAASQADAAAVVIEWSDLDPRLGLRSTGGWAVSVQADILQTCQARLRRIFARIQALAAKVPVALAPPTVCLPALGHTAGWQSSVVELELQRIVAAFLADASRVPGVAVLSAPRLSRVSPEGSRLDPTLELKAGFPYSIPHASALAGELIKLMFPRTPMKGLITDLDDTFWCGIVGEVGVGGVSWSLAEHTQIHGLYQQMLHHLAEMGVLIAAASKNELPVVEQALARQDLLCPAKSVFPVIANWGAKSKSVAEILRVWNIGPEAVVFVDDSPMELDEVCAAFPDMKCLQFHGKQPAKVLALFEELRDLFGKPALQREDALRQASIRANVAVQAGAAESSSADFLRSLQGRLTFDHRKDPANKRALELINKTNQFNLNGARISEGEWMRHLSDPDCFVVSVAYEDKFGPLGIIGAIAGRMAGSRLEVTTWVMSCRAFSRRIEHHTLQHLFEHWDVDAIQLAFQPTARNEPLQQFVRQLDASSGSIARHAFLEQTHELPHAVVVEARENEVPSAQPA
ncbi:MAG: HAD-IIIC family phosphatase [Acidobacteriaceae bacterium]|nr:HAD-IIIC family phosphatase [Acidobacteriaceae bacterium]